VVNMDDTNSTLNALNSTEEVGFLTTTQLAHVDKYKQLKIISSVVVVGGVLLVCAIVYIIYRKTCVLHKARRHGVEIEEAKSSAKGKGKKEYYDPFGVDAADLTVNSVTAILGDKDENTPWNSAHRGSSSGVECDPPGCSDDSNSTQKIFSGKRVFQVNRVNETKRPDVSGQQVIVRLPKGLASAARSVQSSTGHNFTLALYDKHSNTIHNIDLRNYRGRSRGKSPLASESKTPPRPVRDKRRRLHSCGEQGEGTSAFTRKMLHDSPDTPRKSRGMSVSADNLIIGSSSSLTDHSNTNSDARKDRSHSPSLSSKEDDNDDSTSYLLPPGGVS